VTAAPTSERLIVDLGVFDHVRTASGQLVAERVVDQAVRKLEGLLAEGESLDRRGDDSVAVQVADSVSEERLAALERGAQLALASLTLPPGVPPARPSVRRLPPPPAGLSAAA
jgi:hypothetical protein